MHTVEPARQSWIRQIQASARTTEFQRKTHHDIGGCKAVAREIGTLSQFGFQPVQMLIQHCHHRLPRRSPQEAQPVDDQQGEKQRHYRTFCIMKELPVTLHILPMWRRPQRSEEHTSELQSLMRIAYAVFCLKK